MRSTHTRVRGETAMLISRADGYVGQRLAGGKFGHFAEEWKVKVRQQWLGTRLHFGDKHGAHLGSRILVTVGAAFIAPALTGKHGLVPVPRPQAKRRSMLIQK